MKNVKNRVRKILRKINLEPVSIEYFCDIVDYCIKKDIHVLDFNFRRTGFPLLADKYDMTDCCVKKQMFRSLDRSYEITPPDIYEEVLGYKDRITVKKLVIILVNKLNEEELQKTTKKKA